MFLWSEVKTLIIVPHTQATPPQQTIRMIKVIVEIISKTLLCQFRHYVIAFSKQGIFFTQPSLIKLLMLTVVEQVHSTCKIHVMYLSAIFLINKTAEHIPLLSSSFNDLLRSSIDKKKLCKWRTHVIHSKCKRQAMTNQLCQSVRCTESMCYMDRQWVITNSFYFQEDNSI